MQEEGAFGEGLIVVGVGVGLFFDVGEAFVGVWARGGGHGEGAFVGGRSVGGGGEEVFEPDERHWMVVRRMRRGGGCAGNGGEERSWDGAFRVLSLLS